MVDGDLAAGTKLFILSFLLCSCAGLAAVLRSQRKLTPLLCFTAMLNSGLLGLVISLLWYTKFRDNAAFLLGISMLAGLCGTTAMEIILAVLRGKGINVVVSPREHYELPEKKESCDDTRPNP